MGHLFSVESAHGLVRRVLKQADPAFRHAEVAAAHDRLIR
jgi:hypothetical protein